MEMNRYTIKYNMINEKENKMLETIYNQVLVIDRRKNVDDLKTQIALNLNENIS